MGCGASNQAATGAATDPRSGNAQAYTAVVHKPLSMPQRYTHGSVITQGELNNRRNEFWATRTDGNRITWQTLRTVCEALLNEDLALANAILEASSISTPNGSPEVCYDERGLQYKLPQFTYNNPVELTRQPNAVASVSTAPPSMVHDDTTDPVDLSEGEDIKNMIKLRVRIYPGDHNLQVYGNPKHTIQQLKHAIVKEVTRSKPELLPLDVERQRIMFMGKELINTMKVCDVGFDDTKIVQVFVRPKTK